MPIINWSYNRSRFINTTLIWHNKLVDIAPRDFIKEINKTTGLFTWTKQKRIQNLLTKQLAHPEKYTWKQLWSNLKTNRTTTSFKESKNRSFRIKLLHDELPTLDRLTIRMPHLYSGNNSCRTCTKEPETRSHLLTCIELEHLNA